MEISNSYLFNVKTPNSLLIVDDIELNRIVIGNIFKKEYTIFEADSGESALQILDDHWNEICAVLLDVIMPGISGIELLKVIKSNDNFKNIPVFLITSDSRESISKDAYDLGVMDVICKPVIPHIIQRRIDNVVELFRSRQALDNLVSVQKDEILKQSIQISNLNVGMLTALSAAIEFRNGESGEHVQRIHDITKCILKSTPLGATLDAFEIDQIALASIMHDVGKIAIPDSILNKPGPLTDDEFDIMKSHTIQGSMLLQKIPQMRDNEAFKYACDIALHHHERWDGNGYPEGLKGDEISIWAQIVSIADVYDALVSKRVYKDAFSFDKALNMIKNKECGCFNPTLVDAFISVEPGLRKLYTHNR